jgi:hypothetical protein
MGPIQPLGIGRPGFLDRPSTIGDAAQIPGAGLPGATQAAPLMAGQTISAMSVSSSVSQLLSSIGGGVQNNKMLEMMIALLIIMSLLEQQKGGGSGSDALSKLGGLGSGMSSSGISYSSTVVSTQTTSISYTQLQVNQISGGHQAGGATQPQIDTTA